MVIKRAHTPATIPTVPRPERPLNRTGVTCRTGDRPETALEPQQALHRILQVKVAVDVLLPPHATSADDAGLALALQDARSTVESRGDLRVCRIYKPKKYQRLRIVGRYGIFIGGLGRG